MPSRARHFNLGAEPWQNFFRAFVLLVHCFLWLTMTDLSSVLIEVRFDRHTSFPEAHHALNGLYGTVLPDLSTLFVDPNNQVELKDDCCAILTNLVVDSIYPIAVPPAGQADRALVVQVIGALPVKIAWKAGQTGGRLSKAALKSAMLNAATKSDPAIQPCILLVSIQPLFFPANCTYMDWSEFYTTPHSPTNVPPAGAALPISLPQLASQVSSLATAQHQAISAVPCVVEQSGLC